MNTTIKKLASIIPFLNEGDTAKLETGAKLHNRHSRITFQILKADDKTVLVQTHQGKSPAGNYLTQKELIARTKDLFSKFLPDHKINVHATPYEEHFLSKIDADWITAQMETKGVKVKDIATDTALDKTNVSAWANGTRPMSQIVKTMFYYYFQAK
jgi:hypothetical protein